MNGMKTDLKGSIVFVTGASAGIGEACSLAFAREGARLMQAGAAEVHTLGLDVRDRAAVDRAVENLPPEWRGIDVLVNNAGLSRGLDKLYEGSVQDWEEMIDTNVKGLLYVTRAVVPGMVARGRGHVVNLGS